MLRPVTTLLLAFALVVLPVVRDVCGPGCEMGGAPALAAPAAVGGDAASEDGAECPLHPAEDQAPLRESDGCTHDHGTVRKTPQSPSALAPSVPQPVDLPIAAVFWTSPHLMVARRGHAAASPPVEHAPRLLALRV